MFFIVCVSDLFWTASEWLGCYKSMFLDWFCDNFCFVYECVLCFLFYLVLSDAKFVICYPSIECHCVLASRLKKWKKKTMWCLTHCRWKNRGDSGCHKLHSVLEMGVFALLDWIDIGLDCLDACIRSLLVTALHPLQWSSAHLFIPVSFSLVGVRHHVKRWQWVKNAAIRVVWSVNPIFLKIVGLYLCDY